MQSILDFKTTLFSTTGYTFTLALILLLAWWHNRAERGLLLLSLGSGISVLGTVLAYQDMPLFSWAQLRISIFLLLSFHPLTLCAVQSLYRRRMRCGLQLAAFGCAMLAYTYWAGPESVSRRVLVMSGCTLFFWGWIAWELARASRSSASVGHRLAQALSGVVLALSLLRAWEGWQGNEAGHLFGGVLDVYAVLGLFWSTFCFAMAILFISYERLLGQLKVKASQDGLTRLLNQRAFQERARHVLSAPRLMGADPVSLLLIDLDHFKRVNDSHGHQVGDEVLQRLAGCMRQTARRDDVLGRHGGEEFVMLLPRTTAQEAGKVAERLRAAIQSMEYRAAGQRVRISASIGVACREAGDAGGLDSLFLQADRQLYLAKRKGRNRVEVLYG